MAGFDGADWPYAKVEASAMAIAGKNIRREFVHAIDRLLQRDGRVITTGQERLPKARFGYAGSGDQSPIRQK